MSLNFFSHLNNNNVDNENLSSGDNNRVNPVRNSRSGNYYVATRSINSFLSVGTRYNDEDIFIKTKYMNPEEVINEIRYVKKGEYFDFKNINDSLDAKRNDMITEKSKFVVNELKDNIKDNECGNYKDNLSKEKTPFDQSEDNNNKHNNMDIKDNAANMDNNIDWFKGENDDIRENEITQESIAQNREPKKDDKNDINRKDFNIDNKICNFPKINNSNCENNIFGIKGPRVNILQSSPKISNGNKLEKIEKDCSNNKIENYSNNPPILNDNSDIHTKINNIMHIKISNNNNKKESITKNEKNLNPEFDK